jgi:hypothetical protein
LVLAVRVQLVLVVVLAEFLDQTLCLVLSPLLAVVVVVIIQKSHQYEVVKMAALAAAAVRQEQIPMRAAQGHRDKEVMVALMVEYLEPLIMVLAAVVALVRLVEQQLLLLTVLVA